MDIKVLELRDCENDMFSAPNKKVKARITLYIVDSF
jgi:hypothetical protein